MPADTPRIRPSSVPDRENPAPAPASSRPRTTPVCGAAPPAARPSAAPRGAAYRTPAAPRSAAGPRPAPPVRAGGSGSGSAEWIAMYHSVADPTDDPYRITVSPQRLDDQLVRLLRRGLRAVSVRDLVAARARGDAAGLVALSFDDGYADFVDHALPVLRRRGCGATLFVLAGRLGGDNAWDPLGPRKPLLTADGVREAAAAGVEIGSHGLTHVDLTRAGDEMLRAETADSRARLRELTGADVTGFCYPYGTVDPRAVAAVRAAGYRYACAIAPGPLAGELALPRVHIGQEDTGMRLELKRRLSPLRRPMPPYGRTSHDLAAPPAPAHGNPADRGTSERGSNGRGSAGRSPADRATRPTAAPPAPQAQQPPAHPTHPTHPTPSTDEHRPGDGPARPESP
ncbi:Predicted xylanase/chitin deacetylase [Streptomyces sp. AmelKG-E11A]|nr:Predicted xylanase/chitin deacetylase [Streptomyces sp. AmelKG-E11A]